MLLIKRVPFLSDCLQMEFRIGRLWDTPKVFKRMKLGFSDDPRVPYGFAPLPSTWSLQSARLRGLDRSAQLIDGRIVLKHQVKRVVGIENAKRHLEMGL